MAGWRGAAAIACIVHICAAACDEQKSSIYAGNGYDEANDCIEGIQAIDVVSGPDRATCAAQCLIDAEPDAAVRVLVTTACPPAPAHLDSSGTDPACTKALAALARHDDCVDGGGSTNPLDSGSD